jgi:hypothetical protein
VKAWSCGLPLVSVLALLTPGASLAQYSDTAAPILPLAQVRPGMIGEARTVFQGTTPEPFKLRVVSVLRGFLPHQDIILVRGEDPRVESSGIAAGMSGSPVYVDGKLMGAIAYGWSFAKEPLAGVTPIEAMLAERNRPDRPPDPYPVEAKLPTSNAFTEEASPHLQPVAIPLAVSGASDASIAYLDEELRGFGLRPVRSGGAGKNLGASQAAPALVPGSAVGVALVQGDMSTTAMGTLTYSDGKQVLAFGHPMFGIGAVNLPMVVGEIHAIIPSLSSSLKMSSPVAEIGSITDDGKNGVVGVLGEMASKVPVRVRVQSQGKDKAPFSVEVARHRRLLPTLATMAISTALSEAIPDVTDMIAEVTTRLSLRGFAPIELRDQISTNETLTPKLLAMSHGMRALSELLGNPFAPAIVDAIDVAAKVEFRTGTADIVALASSREKVHPGAKLPLRVTLRPYGGAEFDKTVMVEIPRSFAGKAVKIEAAAGAQVKPEMPRAEDLAGFVQNLRTYFPATSLVLGLTSKDDGASLHGRLIHNLPPSALDTLRPASQSRRADSVHMTKQVPFPGSRILAGQREITVQVLPYPEE